MASGITKEKAEQIARDAWRQIDSDATEIAFHSHETAKAWFFLRRFEENDNMIGNVPLMVHKLTGRLTAMEAVRFEFLASDELSLTEKLRRWYNRKFVYGGPIIFPVRTDHPGK